MLCWSICFFKQFLLFKKYESFANNFVISFFHDTMIIDRLLCNCIALNFVHVLNVESYFVFRNVDVERIYEIIWRWFLTNRNIYFVIYSKITRTFRHDFVIFCCFINAIRCFVVWHFNKNFDYFAICDEARRWYENKFEIQIVNI